MALKRHTLAQLDAQVGDVVQYTEYGMDTEHRTITSTHPFCGKSPSFGDSGELTTGPYWQIISRARSITTPPTLGAPFGKSITTPHNHPAVKPFTALAMQVGGEHYKDMPIQPLEFNLKNSIPFTEGSVIKYVCRWRTKGGVDDLKKARHLLDYLIETETSKDTPNV